MKITRAVFFLLIFPLIVGIAVFSAYPVTSAAQSEFPSQDCAGCHAGPVNDVKASGGRHRAVPCIACHLGHPPKSHKAYQNCNRCHLKVRQDHFKLENCLGCHKNPHTPLNITFADIKDICVDCHAAQVAQLRDHKSKHTAVGCATCHNVHGKKPECTQCHKPHTTGMVSTVCRLCHKAHMPMPVTYASDIPSKECGACHKKAFDDLTATQSRHKPLSCSACHTDKHKVVPSCEGCHGSPHPQGIMAKFPKCGGCHNIAHDLNNWPDDRPAGITQKSTEDKAVGQTVSQQRRREDEITKKQ